MDNTIYASFDDIDMAEKAAGALLDHGIRNEDISLIANDRYLDRHTAVTDAAVDSDYNTVVVDRDVPNYDKEDGLGQAKAGLTTTTAADAGSGAAKGAGIGPGCRRPRRISQPRSAWLRPRAWRRCARNGTCRNGRSYGCRRSRRWCDRLPQGSGHARACGANLSRLLRAWRSGPRRFGSFERCRRCHCPASAG